MTNMMNDDIVYHLMFEDSKICGNKLLIVVSSLKCIHNNKKTVKFMAGKIHCSSGETILLFIRDDII